MLHKSASRVHACIAFDTKQQPFIVDLSSTHGEPRTGTHAEDAHPPQIPDHSEYNPSSTLGLTSRYVSLKSKSCDRSLMEVRGCDEASD